MKLTDEQVLKCADSTHRLLRVLADEVMASRGLSKPVPKPKPDPRIWNPPTAPAGYNLYKTVYNDARLNRPVTTQYLFGRKDGCGCTEYKAHGVFLSEDGNRMLTYCGQEGWIHDNWTQEIDPYGDICLHCSRAIRKANFV